MTAAQRESALRAALQDVHALTNDCGIFLAEEELRCHHKHSGVFAKLSQIRELVSTALAPSEAPPPPPQACEWLSYARGGLGWCACGSYGSRSDPKNYAGWEQHKAAPPQDEYTHPENFIDDSRVFKEAASGHAQPPQGQYPKPCGLCDGTIESVEDLDWHGLGNCVPICNNCDGSGIDPHAPAWFVHKPKSASQPGASPVAPPEIPKWAYLPCEWLSYARGGLGYCSCGMLGSPNAMVPYVAWEKHAKSSPVAQKEQK